MFRNLRSLFFNPKARHPLQSRSQYIKHGSSVKIQRVRFVRPLFTLKRAQQVAGWGAFMAFSVFVVIPYVEEYLEDDDLEEEINGENSGANEVKLQDPEGVHNAELESEVVVPDVAPEDAIFIPLGWARQRPQTFYKASDPEWRSFVEFSYDTKRGYHIRNELAGIVGSGISRSREIQKALGSPIMPGAYWLDIDFPDGPPPEYERGGLEFTADYIAWTDRPVSPVNFSRLQRALWPASMTSSFYASSHVFWSLQMAKLKSFFNIQSDSKTPNHAIPRNFGKHPQLLRTDDRQNDLKPGPDTAVKDASRITPSKSLSGSAGSADPAKGLPPLPAIPQPNGDLSSALTAFKLTLAKTWRAPSIPPPRGSFIVSGLVELHGPRGMCVLDVHAAYHPRESRWEAISVVLRRLQERQQGAKGGP